MKSNFYSSKFQKNNFKVQEEKFTKEPNMPCPRKKLIIKKARQSVLLVGKQLPLI